MPADAAGRAAGAFGSLGAALGGAKRDSLARQFNGCVLFDLGDAGKWTLDLRVSAGDATGVRKGAPPPDAPPPDLTLALSEDVFMQLINGEVEPAGALMGGALARERRALSREVGCVAACADAWRRRRPEGARQHGAGHEAGPRAARGGRGARQGEAVGTSPD
jgi:hypothetical protein